MLVHVAWQFYFAMPMGVAWQAFHEEYAPIDPSHDSVFKLETFCSTAKGFDHSQEKKKKKLSSNLITIRVSSNRLVLVPCLSTYPRLD